MSALTRPPYDPELQAALELMPGLQVQLTMEMLPALRSAPTGPPIASLLQGREVEAVDYIVQGHEGAEIVVSVLRRKDHAGPDSPGIYNIHGGGMIGGDRWTGVESLINLVEDFDAVGATVEYRLAPEFPDPVPVEDCYAGLVWFAAQAEELGFDRERVMVMGASAGGGLSAGTVLLARDRSAPHVHAQLLMCPMLDDRNQTVSSQQYDGIGVWDRGSNIFGWGALLGDRAGLDDVSIYAAPGRATDLSNLPPTYIDAGSAEVFRDEAVAYATRIWEAGGQAELHIWAGGFHAFEMIGTAAVSKAAGEAKAAWLRRYVTS